jgi:hypothetical protein
MATSTGKKARRAGGNRYACKRQKAKAGGRRTFGHLAYSVQAKNADSAVEANETLAARMAAARAARGFSPDVNAAV